MLSLSKHEGGPEHGPQVGMAADRVNEASSFEVPRGPVRLRTLIFIRWIAIAGQLVSLLTVNFTLGFDLPLLPTLGAVALSALINLLSTVLWPAQTRLSDTDAALHLGYDVIQLSVLLALTGGLQNPFALLFVVPVTVAGGT